MKHKSLTLLVAIICLGNGLFANPVDVETAKSIATKFLHKNIPARHLPAASQPLQLAYTDMHPQTQANRFYVFNETQQEGFVIVSADDRTIPVLGYSDNGQFDPNNLPDNFAYWLDFYRERLSNLPDHDTPAFDNSLNSTTDEVAPLLGNISYNQNEPYNNLCPTLPGNKRCATGCAATSMAQVMRYYKYPEKGIGSHSYTSKTKRFNLSADFGATTYNWDNMLETYAPNKYTSEEADAVATLLFHCGVSLDMDYNESSGALDIDMIHALVEYFNYDAASIRLRYRDFYDSPSWINIIKQELNEGRPVVYNGQSVGGGHSFVCDGYNADGLFHINWGWGGQSNGYFALDVLDPGTQGIGGGVGGFNFSQTIVTGIQPLADGAENVAQPDLYGLIALFDKESVAGTEKASLQMIYANFGAGKFIGKLALTLENGTDTHLIELGTSSINRGAIGGGTAQISSNDFPAGTYKAYMAYKANGSNEWTKASLPAFLPQYFVVNTKDGQSTFVDNAPQSEPEVSDFRLVDTWYADKPGTFEFTLTNQGSELNQAIGLVLSMRGQFVLLNVQGVYMKDGESKKFSMPSLVDIQPGKYQVMVAVYNTILGLIPLTDPIYVTVEKQSSSIDETASQAIVVLTDASEQLQVTAPESIRRIRLLNLEGKQLHVSNTEATHQAMIPTRHLPAGIYLLEIATDSATTLHKFIKP